MTWPHSTPEAFFGFRKKKTKKRSIPHVPGSSVDLRNSSRKNIFATSHISFLELLFYLIFSIVGCVCGRTIIVRSKIITDLCSGRVTDTWNTGVNMFSPTIFQKSKMAASAILKILWYHQNNEWYIISHVFWSTKHNGSVNF